MPDLSLYKVGVVSSIQDCGSSKGKALRACRVNIGESEELTVVTAASNVREGSRLAVAPVGSTFENDAGEEITVQKTAVGGVMSEGIFCDSKMLGWAGGAAGVAAQIPDTVAIGEAPPATKPRPGSTEGAATESLPTSNVEGLFEKKLSKEEKKKLAEERRKARKAAKEGAKKDASDE
uniref:tRNA-binding domain-containing protein n=1 Tax=Amphora coffeiformis TaxID=265554 RepID=A0A7S3LFE6_9STRA|mmetsp:Transcript_21549/g.40895  ORF Transcript_21549/g.40895 Transcript_21549/m.40895 type:complete len:178 (+) Transcript_21549:192-725(+)